MRDSATAKKRENRIVLYAKIGFCLFAILAALSGHSEYLFAVVAVAILVVGGKVIFNLQSYAALEAKHKRGSLDWFPFLQLIILVPLLLGAVGIAWLVTTFIGQSS